MNVRELLRDADPLRDEDMYSPERRDLCRQEVLATGSCAGPPRAAKSTSRAGMFAVVMLLVIAASVFALRAWSPLITEVQAAVRFEMRLAEERPGPGLREAKVSDSGRSVWLHDQALITNSDIVAAKVIAGEKASEYDVDLKFSPAASEKIQAATSKHVNRPVAMLIDGRVIAAPVVRDAMTNSAVVSGHFTRTQAQRIVNGIGIR